MWFQTWRNFDLIQTDSFWLYSLLRETGFVQFYAWLWCFHDIAVVTYSFTPCVLMLSNKMTAYSTKNKFTSNAYLWLLRFSYSSLPKVFTLFLQLKTGLKPILYRVIEFLMMRCLSTKTQGYSQTYVSWMISHTLSSLCSYAFVPETVTLQVWVWHML